MNPTTPVSLPGWDLLGENATHKDRQRHYRYMSAEQRAIDVVFDLDEEQYAIIESHPRRANLKTYGPFDGTNASGLAAFRRAEVMLQGAWHYLQIPQHEWYEAQNELTLLRSASEDFVDENQSLTQECDTLRALLLKLSRLQREFIQHLSDASQDDKTMVERSKSLNKAKATEAAIEDVLLDVKPFDDPNDPDDDNPF